MEASQSNSTRSMARRNGTGSTVTPEDPALTRISRQACVIMPVNPAGILTSTKEPLDRAFSVAVLAEKIVSIGMFLWAVKCGFISEAKLYVWGIKEVPWVFVVPSCKPLPWFRTCG